ncbi:MAG TPA: hypothetical protein VMF69_17635 [Gemmataceae bacterium]|nr:hypothetical protein [Gemmataceae bacterium]
MCCRRGAAWVPAATPGQQGSAGMSEQEGRSELAVEMEPVSLLEAKLAQSKKSLRQGAAAPEWATDS